MSAIPISNGATVSDVPLRQFKSRAAVSAHQLSSRPAGAPVRAWRPTRGMRDAFVYLNVPWSRSLHPTQPSKDSITETFKPIRVRQPYVR